MWPLRPHSGRHGALPVWQGVKALVTGAGRRIGRDMALYLAGRGFDLAVHCSTSAAGAAQTVADIVAMGRNAVCLQADLLHEDQVETLIQRAAKALGGPLTLLVNNASIFEYDNITTATRSSWDRHIGSNLRAPFVLTQGFAAQAPKAAIDAQGELVAQALIVNMLDQRVLKPTPEFMTYALAKMGLWALTRSTAQALAPHIRVNGIGPGPTMQGARQSAAHFAAQRKATILQRGASSADICKALGFLLDCPSVTGQMIAVDGGQHLVWQTQDVLGVE